MIVCVPKLVYMVRYWKAPAAGVQNSNVVVLEHESCPANQEIRGSGSTLPVSPADPQLTRPTKMTIT